MIDAEDVPDVGDDELLARYIVNSNEYRKKDDTVRHLLFLPYKHVDLSVNRHLNSNEEEIWMIGSQVADKRNRTLYGRADISAMNCRIEPLDVVSKPQLPDNPNHADITGFPPEKHEQMSLAAKLAAAAKKRIATPVE